MSDYDPQQEMVESLIDLATAKQSPWLVSYEWSDEAQYLREVAIKSPWIVDDQFVWSYFRTLRILDKGVSDLIALQTLTEHVLSF